jgi:excisionase family DNA binding protein
MKKGEKLAEVADYAAEQAAGGVLTQELDPPRTCSKEGSRREGRWRLGPIMSPRTSDFSTAALLEDLRQIVREEVRALQQAILQALTDSARTHSPDTANPDEQLTVEQVAEAMHVITPTVRMWIRQGNLRASRPPGVSGEPGRVYRIARVDLKDFIEATQRNVQHGESEADLRAEAARIVAIDTHRRRT